MKHKNAEYNIQAVYHTIFLEQTSREQAQDVVPPISTLPGLGPLRIPSPVPIPNFARLYFR